MLITDSAADAKSTWKEPNSSLSSIYASPRIVTDLSECRFYHAMDLPGYGFMPGWWDLRGHEEEYLGHASVRGKRVLEIGTASGYLCFHMEKQGAEVVAYDLSEEHGWDLVPFPELDPQELMQTWQARVHRINNAFWLAHRAFASSARVVYGSVYDIPAEVGPVDIATFGCVLLHVRDPLAALASALRLTRGTVIITEPLMGAGPPCSLFGRLRQRMVAWLLGRKLPPHNEATMTFLPQPHRTDAPELWWAFTPEILCRFLAVLGFADATVTYHTQLFQNRKHPMFTVVAQRTS